MQRLVDMSTSELIHTALQYSASIKEIGIYSELVKELITRLGANTAAVTQALKERDEAREQVVNLALENAGLKSVTTLFGEAFDDLFSQCCSNPVTNAWGKPVNFTLVNKAREQSSVKTPATDAAIANIKAQVWIEAKDLTKSMLAADSVDHIDFLFDGKVQQLRKEAGNAN